MSAAGLARARRLGSKTECRDCPLGNRHPRKIALSKIAFAPVAGVFVMMDRAVFGCLTVIVALTISPFIARAEVPRVFFDMPYVVACRDVTPSEFAESNPSEKLVEARFQISSLLASGSEQDLVQFFYRIDSPQRTFAISDYLPKTLHESAIAGTVGIKNTDEQTMSLGINFSGHYECLTGASATSGVGQKNVSGVEYQKLPALETVVASGTILRGTGVYFKLKSNERNLLEGERSFAVVLRVPLAWRADYVHLRCEAEGVKRGVVRSLDETVRSGERDFLVGLYLEGDEQGRAVAEHFAASEARLRQTAQARSKQIQQRAYPTLVQKVGAALSLTGPQIPENWLPNLLYGNIRHAAISERLPADVSTSVADFSSTRERLRQMSGIDQAQFLPASATKRQ
jgi:hypothetical protein